MFIVVGSYDLTVGAFDSNSLSSAQDVFNLLHMVVGGVESVIYDSARAGTG